MMLPTRLIIDCTKQEYGGCKLWVLLPGGRAEGPGGSAKGNLQHTYPTNEIPLGAKIPEIS